MTLARMNEPGRRRPALAGAALLLLATLLLAVVLPGPVVAGNPGSQEISATLDGKAIDPREAGRYYCETFGWPEVRCYSSAAALETSLSGASFSPDAAAATSGYVTVFDGTSFTGTYMHISSDVSALGWFGWNDRTSSFVVHGSWGSFWTDWFYGGNRYTYCCNVQIAWLGAYDNTFSSVEVN
jgi:hypothetical protein